jgi:hypothetical protein
LAMDSTYMVLLKLMVQLSRSFSSSKPRVKAV